MVTAIKGNDTSTFGGAITANNVGAGNVLQVVYNSDNTNAITSTGGATITAVSASITPSSTSSKILIFARLATRYIKQGSNVAGWASPKIYRGDSTVISPAPGQNYEQGINFGDANWGDFRLIATIQSLDSPNTTSSTTYSARMTLYDTQASLQINESGVYHSTITLMEIAG